MLATGKENIAVRGERSSPGKGIVSNSDPLAVVDHVAPEGRGQLPGRLLELAEPVVEADAFRVHDDVEEGDGGAGIMRGLHAKG